jgi:hypothetical protein
MTVISNWFKNTFCACLYPDVEAFKLKQELYNVTKKYKISILPIASGFDLDNLYPLTNHVAAWSTFIVGKDKTYILANCKNLKIENLNTDKLLNHTGEGIIPDEMREFLDPIWDRTLMGNQCQFYMVFNGQTYFANSYPFLNNKKKVIGGILFLRLYETMPDVFLQNEIPVKTDSTKATQ